MPEWEQRRMRRKDALWISTALLLAALGFTLRPKAFANENPVDLESTERQVRSFVDTQIQTAVATYPGRVEVTVGSLDARLRLAACRRVEPFMPAGARLWGKAHVGLRCREGAAWTVYLPIEIRIYGQALVTTRAIAAGHLLAPEDVRIEEVELTREPPGAITDTAALVDRLVGRPLASGTVLRAEHLKVRPVVAQGDQVKVVFLGEGFAVASEGKALASAGAGQAVRVQMESGRIVSGTAREGRRVELR